MYISGLSNIEYMHIEQNIKPYHTQNELNKNSTDF